MLDIGNRNNILGYFYIGTAVLVIILTIYFYMFEGVFTIWLGALIISTGFSTGGYRLKHRKIFINIGMLFLGLWMIFTPIVFELVDFNSLLFVKMLFLSCGVVIAIISVIEL